jgi:hypothetical protein
VSRERVTLEFLALLALGLLGYRVQAAWTLGGQLLAILLYVLFAVFFWKRGRALAAANGRITGAIVGERLGRASETISAALFPAIGILALAALPAAALYALIG